jgi:hypothetical protein
MFEILGAVGLLAFAASSAAIGVRLLLLGRRTRGVPELALGTGFLVGCIAGYVPETIVLSTDLLPVGAEPLVLAATQVAIRVAAISVLVFTWNVFRPNEGWATAFAVLIGAALVMSWLAFPYARVHAQSGREVFWYDFFAAARTLAVGWGSVEALVYHARSRRRLRLGLSDAAVTNRLLLWGIGLAAMSSLMASTLMAEALRIDPSAPGWVALESLAGLVGATTLWLTFFPSRAYLAFIERRAARRMPDGSASGRRGSSGPVC